MGTHINVERYENGKEIREKRTKQLTKEELEWAIEEFDNDKKQISIHFGIREWSVREQIKKYGLVIDGRVKSNNIRKIPIPPRDELIELYTVKNMTLLDIGKYYNTSNVTVKKWFIEYNIKLLSHKDTIKNKVVPKIEKFNIEKYGTPHFYRTEEFKTKSKETLLEKYGVPYYPFLGTSKAELDVLNFFNSLMPGFEKTNIFNIELDGYNNKINVAFEYCGLYWHREDIKGKKSHIKKYNICKENGIRLFTIFEDEWIYRNTQVKNFITAALNMNENKIFARKLKCVKYEKNDTNILSFLNHNHIQGAPSMSTTINHYALTYNDKVFSVMSIGRHHRKNDEIVLNRYCVKYNYNIIGGAKKLFNHVLRDYFTIIKTWSDNRWTEGYLYDRLGFTLYREYNQDYSYIGLNGNAERKSKQSMMKKNIGAKDNQTELDRAKELNFDRIWDCGKKTWIFDNTK